jgi:hypothetical protein
MRSKQLERAGARGAEQQGWAQVHFGALGTASDSLAHCLTADLKRARMHTNDIMTALTTLSSSPA